jgi:hypothetical protein
MDKKVNPAIIGLPDKEIDIFSSPILFDQTINEDNFKDLFDIYNSSWTVEDGWLTGHNPDESAGMAILKKDFPGNVLLHFLARTVKPSTHDINFMWNGEWDSVLNSCGNAYIGSLCGWYSVRAGIEKSPGYKFRATSSNKCFEPFKQYEVFAGSIDGNCFIVADGELLLEVEDPEPLDNKKYSKVAFTAWSSHIQVRNIVIRQVAWKPVSRRYFPEKL